MTRSERQNAAWRLPRTRRELLDGVLVLGGMIWTVGVLAPAAMFLWPARSRGPTTKYVEVELADFPPATARVLQADGKPILVLRLANGEFRALSAVCTHLGCLVHWAADEGHVLCPCHAGVFSTDGSVVSGPPPRPLPTYPTRVVEDRLRIEV